MDKEITGLKLWKEQLKLAVGAHVQNPVDIRLKKSLEYINLASLRVGIVLNSMNVLSNYVRVVRRGNTKIQLHCAGKSSKIQLISCR